MRSVQSHHCRDLGLDPSENVAAQAKWMVLCKPWALDGAAPYHCPWRWNYRPLLCLSPLPPLPILPHHPPRETDPPRGLDPQRTRPAPRFTQFRCHDWECNYRGRSTDTPSELKIPPRDGKNTYFELVRSPHHA